MICERGALTSAVRRAAVKAGAMLIAGTARPARRTSSGEHEVALDGDSPVVVTARHVVLAVGTRGPAEPSAAGIAATRRFATIGPIPEARVVMALPAPHETDPHERPTSVWADLKTEADGDQPNNLLSLPECPGF